MNIIGGSAKGTVLVSPAGMKTRPTLSRVRESVFNVLANVGLIDTKVLDLFAGTGAMGLEALSRGAREAVLLDKSTGKIIRENARRCHVEDRVRVVGGDISQAIRSLTGETFDYIFMDPPYRKGYIESVLDIVFACGLAADNAIIIAEHSVSEPLDAGRFPRCVLWKEKRVGAICTTYLLCRNSKGESV